VAELKEEMILVIPQPLINSPWVVPLFTITLALAAARFAGENMTLAADNYL
jgi:hypothetical protein